MIARFSLLFLCKGYRYCQRCIGLIKALKLISKGTSVRLLLNIECYSGICLMLRVTKLCKGFFFLPELIKWPVQDYPFQWFSACFLEPFGSITNKKTFEGNTFKFRLQFPVLNFTFFFPFPLFLLLESYLIYSLTLFYTLQIFASSYVYNVLSRVFCFPGICCCCFLCPLPQIFCKLCISLSSPQCFCRWEGYLFLC